MKKEECRMKKENRERFFFILHSYFCLL